VKTLMKAGIITARTAPTYANWVDMKGLEAEGDAMVGDAIAAGSARSPSEGGDAGSHARGLEPGQRLFRKGNLVLRAWERVVPLANSVTPAKAGVQ
jgi:hypothetical protein